jgi:hypothetical protein
MESGRALTMNATSVLYQIKREFPDSFTRSGPARAKRLTLRHLALSFYCSWPNGTDPYAAKHSGSRDYGGELSYVRTPTSFRSRAESSSCRLALPLSRLISSLVSVSRLVLALPMRVNIPDRTFVPVEVLPKLTLSKVKSLRTVRTLFRTTPH